MALSVTREDESCGFVRRPPRNRLCRAAGGAPWGEAPKALRGGPI